MAVLAAGVWRYHTFMSDDAFISLRYADRFLHGLGLTWNDGEVVEGYTNLLWVLGCALLGSFGLDLVWAARVLGFVGTAGAVAAILWAYRGDTIRESLPGITGGLAVAVAGPVVVWTFGGLEQPLLAGLLAWAIALAFPLLEDEKPRTPQVLLTGVFLGLVVLTRADGAIFTLAACLGVLAAKGLKRGSVRLAIALAIVPAAFFLGQLAFRMAYYGEWVPNSAFAKVGFTATRLWNGIQYLMGAIYLGGLVVPAFLAFRITDEPSRSRARFLGVMLATWLVYIVVVGGDLFPGRRHLVPAIIPLAYLAAIYFTSRVPREGSLRSAAQAAGLCLLAIFVGQMADPENARAYHEKWEWDGEAVGGTLATAFAAQKPLLAADPAGCLPYFSRLPSVDMLGINDRYLAHNRPPDFGTGYLGHELGNGAYVLSRKPDLVLFNDPSGSRKPNFRSGTEMMSDPRGEFASTFRPVTLECDRPRHVVSLIWMRTEGGAIGIRRSEQRIQIPGHLFSDNEESRARLDPEGRIGVTVLPHTFAEFSGLPVPPGTWTIRIVGSGIASLYVEDTRTGNTVASGGSGSSFQLEGESPVKLTMMLRTLEQDGAHVRELVLERAASTQDARPRPRRTEYRVPAAGDPSPP